MYKKAQIIDMMYLAFVLFLTAIIGIVAYKVIIDWNDEAAGNIDADNLAMSQTFEDRFPRFLDQLFMLVLVGVSAVSLISAFMVNSHPVFYAFFMIVLGFLSWFNAMYANVYYDFVSSDAFTGIANSFPMINIIMRFFPMIIFTISLIIGIAMMAKGE